MEFFTKRGRPLSKDEIQKLVEEDRREKEQELARKRAEEEAERRRNQRIIGDLEEEEDFETFAMRQKAERGDAAREARRAGQLADRDGEDSYGSASDEDRLFYGERSDGEEGEEELYDSEDDRDSLGRERPDRPGTAGREGKGLSRAKLTNKDYLARAQSAKQQRKGKYGVTVPKPFAFDTREAKRAKTIREWKVEAMVHEKEAKTVALLHH